MSQKADHKADIIIVGAGHNALVAATFLARAGHQVVVLEEKPVIGGAARTERPFSAAPDLAASTGAYLLGLMPPELIARLGVDLPVLRRDPHYFLPRPDEGYLMFGADRDATRRQLLDFFSPADWEADCALQAELDALREDLGPTWLQSPLSIEETAARHVRPALQQTFVDLCRGSIGDHLARFGFESELIMAMYAVTDGFTGLDGGWDSPGTGMNFLIHNMCRLPASDGTWMIVKGGMGVVSQRLADAARAAGARIETDRGVASIELDRGHVCGVLTHDGALWRAPVVVVGADPFRLQRMVGADHLPDPFNARLDAYRRDGTTLKVNLCLRDLPRFTCLPERRGQHRATIHLLPDEGGAIAAQRRAYEAVKAGRLADFPSIEWYIHTTVDPSLQDAAGHHNAALFVQWVPYALADSSWDDEEDRYVAHLLSICDRYAPGTSDLVVDTFPLTPPRIEAHFGMSRGHIHHVDNSFGFADRLPYRLPIDGLYACGAGCHPGGSVIGAAGHNAAQVVLEDMAAS